MNRIKPTEKPQPHFESKYGATQVDKPAVVVIPHGFQEHYSIGFANGVANSGIGVEFICSSDHDQGLLDKRIQPVNLGHTIFSSKPAWSKAIEFMQYHLRLVAHVLVRRRSVIHVIGLLRREIFMGIIEGLWFRFVGRKYMLTVHNVLPHDQHTHFKRLLYGIIYRIPHHLIVHTHKMKKDLIREFGLEPTRIVVMQHGINDVVADHGKSKEECRSLLGLPLDKHILLFFGRIAPYKGVDTLLEALHILPVSCMIVIAGRPKSKAYENHIREIVGQHPRRHDVVFHSGWIASSDIATYFHAADVVVMPYKHIDQSGILFLALRYSVPVISFNVGAISEYVGHGTGVLVDGTEPADLAHGVEIFIEQIDLFTPQRIADQAITFRWESVVTPVLQYYST